MSESQSSSKKTVLVTGSTDGIGKETALELARRGFRVIVHGRSEEKVSAARDEISRSVKDASLEGFWCDLSSLAEVRSRAPALLQLAPKLDVLLLNAGVYVPKHTITAEGFELTFVVSHLASFLLTKLILPALRAAAPARVIAVSSQLHRSGKIDFADLNGNRNYSPYTSYGQAKLCNVLFANGLAARFSPEVLTANSLHPGVVGTKMLRQGFGVSNGPDSLAEGAATSVFLASSEKVAGITGRYFSRSREAPANPDALSESIREKLWAKSEELTQIKWDEQP
jgi:NAD(P)-dependent dehydrogenase (short-subunit alcohol dehydrogenase family)